jgi:N-acetylglutamate synthase-like GNAT family acetyltransferase
MSVIRRARPAEAGVLSDLALRAKGYWGYDAAFLEACRAELTIAPESIAERAFYVVEEDGQVRGFYALAGSTPEDELDDLFVEPDAIGKGYGRLLWDHATATMRANGTTSFIIQADPYAEGFYRAMGAERIGESPSGSIPGRMLPMLRCSLTMSETAR